MRVLTVRALKRGRLEAGRFEELVPFLIDFFDRRGLLTGVVAGSRRAISTHERLGARALPRYFDDELRELVGHKSRWLTERFRYSF